jgi:hypothetical protein
MRRACYVVQSAFSTRPSLPAHRFIGLASSAFGLPKASIRADWQRCQQIPISKRLCYYSADWQVGGEWKNRENLNKNWCTHLELNQKPSDP